jgi:hypothetical protein
VDKASEYFELPTTDIGKKNIWEQPYKEVSGDKLGWGVRVDSANSGNFRFDDDGHAQWFDPIVVSPVKEASPFAALRFGDGK